MNKKKYLLGGVLVIMLLLSGCSKKYIEGIYTGTATDNYGGQSNTATAIVTINDKGEITDVKLDTTYTTEDGTNTTKKALGDAYGMYGHEYGSEIGEWYQQVEALEKKVVTDGGLQGINLTSDGTTDSVSGCTIKIDALYAAIEDALKQAQK